MSYDEGQLTIDVSRIRFSPGDLCVVTIDELGRDEVKAIGVQLREILPGGVFGVVIPKGMRLDALIDDDMVRRALNVLNDELENGEDMRAVRLALAAALTTPPS